MAYLLVDDRERAVIAHLRTRAPEPAPAASWEVARLGNGDYSVVTKDAARTTLAIFERKTYHDFAASIKDGRVDNISRLVALAAQPTQAQSQAQAQHRVRVGIILEGRPSRGCSTVDGIPIANIRAKLDHLWMRDDVYLMETRDEDDTAARLLAFVAHTTSLLAKLKQHASMPAASPTPAPIIGSDAAASRAISQFSIAQLPVAPPTVRDDVIAMYCTIPTIGPAKARTIVDSGTSLAEYIARPDTPYAKYHTRELDISMLAAITRMTQARARALIEFAHGSLASLFAMDALALDAFTINGKRAHALTARVLDCAHFAEMPQ